MERDYPLTNIINWCEELKDAVLSFKEKYQKTPFAVGYSQNNYKKINFIVNQEKENLVHTRKKTHPRDSEYVELSSVQVFEDVSLQIAWSEDMDDDHFVLIYLSPDGDDGEPYIDQADVIQELIQKIA